MTITKQQIDSWKEQYRKVFKITVEGKIAYLKAPDRKTLSYAASIGSKDPMKYNEVLLKNCWLGGDMEIQTDDSLFLSACSQLVDLIEIKEATLEKL